MEPFDDENVPLYTVGQVADMLSLKQAFLRRIDELQVVSPQRSAGRQRRYTRVEIRVIQQVATMADEGMTMPAIRRIIELEQLLTEVVRQRDDLAARLSAVSAERVRLAHQLAALLPRAGQDEPAGELGRALRSRHAWKARNRPAPISSRPVTTTRMRPPGCRSSVAVRSTDCRLPRKCPGLPESPCSYQPHEVLSK